MSANYTARCEPGLVVPMWRPEENLYLSDIIFRGTVYFLQLLHLFIGVSIISDRFMAAIEVITSKEKELIVRRPGKEPQIVVVRVWNETVANLTLMALGSSAPEILLSIIEIWAKNFQAGELGPGTIVGSADQFEQTRRDYINTLRELRKKHPTLPLEQLEVMAHEDVLGKGPKSRAFYRVQATRKMVGAGNLSKKISERAQSDLSEVKAELQRQEAQSIDIENVNAMRIFFEPGPFRKHSKQLRSFVFDRNLSKKR